METKNKTQIIAVIVLVIAVGILIGFKLTGKAISEENGSINETILANHSNNGQKIKGNNSQGIGHGAGGVFAGGGGGGSSSGGSENAPGQNKENENSCENVSCESLKCSEGICLERHFVEFNITNKWADFYGNITINGENASVGDEVGAFLESGELCGSFLIRNEGLYGFLHCYKETSISEEISFRVYDWSEDSELNVSNTAGWQERQVIEVNLEI